MQTPEERAAFIDKIRSLNFQGTKAASKKVIHHTDTAIVTETHRDDGQDTHVEILQPTTNKKDTADV